MASLITHAVVGGAIGTAGKSEWRSKPSYWIAVIVCSILPDIDVIGFRMGVHYADFWGHRGMTHSLLFAAVVAGAIAILMGSNFAQRWKLGLLLFTITASHGLLDALTDGGLGIAFFSPFLTERYFFPWRPIHVSPIGATAFFSPRGSRILWSEILWVWIPAAGFAGAIWTLRSRQRRQVKIGAADPSMRSG